MNKTILVSILAVILIVLGGFLWKSKQAVGPDISGLLESSVSASPTINPSHTPTPTNLPKVTRTTTPTPNGKTTFVGEKVPWELLLADASCQLKGEIKFLDEKTYDNQDAIFIYKGVDHPARNIKWTISPAEPNIEVGPNIFNKMPLPDGQSLLGIFPKGPLSAKKYTLTASMQYGRLVDAQGKFVTVGGNVRVSQKLCQGQTTIVFP